MSRSLFRLEMFQNHRPWFRNRIASKTQQKKEERRCQLKTGHLLLYQSRCLVFSVLRLVPTGSVPTPAGRYRPGYRPAPVGKRGNRERGAVALPTGRAVGTDRRWSRARSVPTGRYRPGRSVPTPRPVGCHAALCDWPTAATSAPRQLAVAISRF